MLTVTKTTLPDFDQYISILRRAWSKGYVTNNGALVQELETQLRQYLQSPLLWYCSNGTVVLQMAIKALQLQPGDEIITTPFSYVATANAIAWEQCRPVFADIDPNTCCIDATQITRHIGTRTKAILATHVYGLPCDTAAINSIAKQYNLTVIYDAAHAFGVHYLSQPLLQYGDMATCSFHATKLFHTVEGGCIISHNETLHHTLELYRQFGHIGEEYSSIGINAKNSELHAAMGLAMLPMMDGLIAERRQLFEQYRQLLQGLPLRMLQPEAMEGLQWNYAYFPVFFETENTTLRIRQALEEAQILTRRYFHPSLNTLPFYGPVQQCAVSEQLAATVLCLPFFNGLSSSDQERVASIIRQHC